ncbi:UDP-glucose 4-epimerase GalE [candidate division WWE3 bacterium]|jgi:UDP-glucose 4-epimerase|uniref:UDP-glucose 4-epimerase n=1 Tax=candidate division WWE3 bacterium TaxID=2053526 RepID=A0A3A4ZIF9_UNCKA|nr:MAG: UDP-glucose 4-epimerase GalE [candidate division WWE3 bacterium]
MAKVLVTGGAGYIGSHVVKALGERGYQVLTYDSLVTGKPWAVLYGDLVIGDLLDIKKLQEVISEFKPEAVMHFAAHIVVPESVAQPLKYYVNNVQGTLNLLSAMAKCGVNKLIFSSSAAVYGVPERVPIPEEAPLQPINPYGHTKAMVEQVLKDLSAAGEISYVSLRYFNVAGADRDGRIGEGKEDATHLITLCTRAAAGIRSYLSVFGTDYPTPDGTCIRDYIHVEDLAEAHVLGLEHLLAGRESEVFNCGYGKGYSVREVIEAAKKVTGVDFPVKYEGRRPGDPPVLVADSQKIRAKLGWVPSSGDLERIVYSAWRWEQKRKVDVKC